MRARAPAAPESLTDHGSVGLRFLVFGPPFAWAHSLARLRSDMPIRNTSRPGGPRPCRWFASARVHCVRRAGLARSEVTAHLEQSAHRVGQASKLAPAGPHVDSDEQPDGPPAREAVVRFQLSKRGSVLEIQQQQTLTVSGLLWRDLLLGLLVRSAELPSASALEDRARETARAVLALHGPDGGA